MFDTMGYGVFMFFASLMLLSFVFVWFLLPETKGVPLEAMDRLFAYKPPRAAHKVIMSDLRMEEEDFRRNSVAGEIEISKDEKGAHFEVV